MLKHFLRSFRILDFGILKSSIQKFIMIKLLLGMDFGNHHMDFHMLLILDFLRMI